MKSAVMVIAAFTLVITGRTVMKTKTCVTTLDRLVVAGVGFGSHLPDIPGFKVIKDFAPKPQGKLRTYRRVRIYRSTTSSARIVLQYQPVPGWLKPWRFTLIADDATGISPEEIVAVIGSCSEHTVTMVELAFDFSPAAGVNRNLVLRHGRFGKSHRKPKIGGPDYLRYGTRASAKLVRCYFKPEVNRYRVELECHAALLKSIGVSKAPHLPKLAQVMCPAHLEFVNLNEGQLKQHLIKKFGRTDALRILDTAAERYTSLQRATRFLTSRGVWNVNRFLRPRAINAEIRRALDRWAAQFTPDALDPGVGEV